LLAPRGLGVSADGSPVLAADSITSGCPYPACLPCSQPRHRLGFLVSRRVIWIERRATRCDTCR
jgi:hypothetical protein